MKIRKLVPFIPYVAVLLGMYGLRSAIMAMGLYHVGILAAVLPHRKTIKIGSTRSSLLTLLSVFVYAGAGVLLYFLWPHFAPDSGSIADSLKDFGISKPIFIYFAVYFSLANALFEEFFWRGYLGSDLAAVDKHDIFFGGYHALVLLAFAAYYWAVPLIIVCSFGAWLWRQLRRISGGLAIPITTHIVADISIVLAVYFRLFA